MDDMNTEHKLIQSYVFTSQDYFVSTAFRKSTAQAEVPLWYYETIVFWYNTEKKKVGSIESMHDSGSNPTEAMQIHFGICKELIED